MSHTPHELIEEFPQEADLIHRLKTTDAHFAKLAEEYHRVNRELHQMETNVKPVDERYEIEMRKTRMGLKDQLWKMIAAAL